MKNLYLYARNGRFYFKMRIPLPLCKIFGCSSLRRSLRTKSLLEANHVANILRERFKELFKRIDVKEVSSEEIEASVKEKFIKMKNYTSPC
jgi:hypothetical protein